MRLFFRFLIFLFHSNPRDVFPKRVLPTETVTSRNSHWYEEVQTSRRKGKRKIQIQNLHTRVSIVINIQVHFLLGNNCNFFTINTTDYGVRNPGIKIGKKLFTPKENIPELIVPDLTNCEVKYLYTIRFSENNKPCNIDGIDQFL